MPSLGKRVSVFWNDTVESSRAAKAALPFLKQADAVQIKSVLDDSVDADLVKAFAASLAWHGVKADVRLVEADDRSAGEALIDAAWEFEADLIVMGAFSPFAPARDDPGRRHPPHPAGGRPAGADGALRPAATAS